MKIFISHSSKDKWIARRISQDLEGYGIETFLDEKDIETGDSIDDSIQAHLSGCDEVLMLLSPTALTSHWVLIEVGGAKALGKRLVPILLHVRANELPQPIGKGLARDLNDIERYYLEVQARADGEEAAELPDEDEVFEIVDERSRPSRREFETGDRVRIPDEPQPDHVPTDGVGVDWAKPMNTYLGRTATVTEVDGDRTVKLDVDDETWWWFMDWLEPA